MLGNDGTGPTLKFNGATVTVGQFGAWTPIAAEQTSSGYEVAFKNAVLGSYTVWNTDSNGAYANSPTGAVAGSDFTLETLETSFHQDLNGDGTIGPPPPTVVEAFGATILGISGSQYVMNPVAGGTGPTLKFNGATVTVGQFGAWTPFAAEQTSGGYEVAFKNIPLGSYVVWNTDNSGAYTNSATAVVTASDFGLQTLETSFQQDLNGDGTIGPPPPTVVEGFGATILGISGNRYVMNPVAGGTGPTLKFNGATVTVGQFGAWTPFAAEQTATGYEIAFKNTPLGSYVVWNTDSSGVYTNSATAVVTGSNFALEQLETSFQQDLNGDGRLSTAVSLGTNGSDTRDLTTQTAITTVNLGGNTAQVSAGLNQPSLAFIGTPDAIVLGTAGATIEYALAPSSGIETIANFTLGRDELNIDLMGSASNVLQAFDTTVSGNAAIAITSSADRTHGIVLLSTSGQTAASLLPSHLTVTDGHALIG
jgi:serralysin